MRRSSGRLLALSAVAAVAGCGDIIGLGDYDLDGGTIDATNDVNPGGDAQPDVKSDVVSDVVGNDVVIPPTCNQNTSVCVPELPSGWTWAVYDPDARPACANGYAAPKDVEEGLDAGPASCTCGCTTTNPSCATGTVTITAGTNNCNNITNQTDVADAGCNALTQFSTNGASISVTGPAPSGGSCNPTPSQQLPTVDYDHMGRTCDMTATPSDAGCTAGNVCVPNPTPFTMCISQIGAQTCPTEYPNQHVIGTALTDTRGCTACGCTFDAGACQGTATIYTSSNCSSGATQIPATGACTVVNGNRTWRGYAYSPTSTASCAGTAVSPDGGVVFADLTTICCK